MLIQDVIRDWAQMDGATFLDKQVNALLTARLGQALVEIGRAHV